MNTNKKLLGKRIKELRKNKGLTQEQLAEFVGLETSSLSGIESGRHFPSFSTLEKIANCLNVELRTIFNYNHLISLTDMKNTIINNLDKLDPNTISVIYRFCEEY